jgi:hypothetical protein
MEDLRINDRIILKQIFKYLDGEPRTSLVWLRIGTGGMACECGNELPVYIKCWKFLD